jgi:hypothetical protein
MRRIKELVHNVPGSSIYLWFIIWFIYYLFTYASFVIYLFIVHVFFIYLWFIYYILTVNLFWYKFIYLPMLYVIQFTQGTIECLGGTR